MYEASLWLAGDAGVRPSERPPALPGHLRGRQAAAFTGKKREAGSEVPDCAPPTALDSCRVRHVALTTPPASRPHRQPSFASKAPEGALSLVDNEEVRRTGDLEGLWSACCGL